MNETIQRTMFNVNEQRNSFNDNCSKTVKESVEIAFKMIHSNEFFLHDLISIARNISGREYVYSDTFRRKFFELREEGVISFFNSDKKQSKYTKGTKQHD